MASPSSDGSMEWKVTNVEYFYTLCQPALEGIIIGLSILISVKIAVSFILILKRKKDARMDK